MVDKISLHWEEQGSGEPLVLLHGNGEDGSIFRSQLEHFSQKYRVIAVDTRGHGRSPRGTAPFNFDTFAQDLRDFLEERGLGKIHLLGFSDGGNTALTFALRWPEHLRSLIVVGANLDPSGLKTSFLLPMLLDCCVAKGKAALRSQPPCPDLELLTLMVEEPDIPPESLAAIPVPTLVVAGTDDIIRGEHTRLIHRSIPGSRLAIIAGDHFTVTKKSRLFNRAVENFLDRLPQPEETQGEQSPVWPREKDRLYPLLAAQAAALTEGETDPIANMANLAALLWQALPEVNWAGFYRRVGEELVLGPFQGKPACIRIPWGQGVCGTAAAEKTPQLVPDVHAFPGHIACDAVSRSELVIPLLSPDGEVLGVLDLDSPAPGRFTQEDLEGLLPIAGLLTEEETR